ncbi:heme lyase CcmF/NrfE family subunit [Maridesulfovibrio hydrothermalis]|uniref:Cytochrome c assembly protein n=1 Tax=Maridesulfovibrio hydrothermalis AM13 = DSM 14728 TaxID=1121451 RepID=L0R5X0_9BACT|nr:cytochrome c-type biogenesis CcmF C-terminal domain-containing protein [Maridesulfovibrio hydrothermalis]CCO22083.1 Cytochrome c assembly protein [Maridesulfovibrio hydrothermalis AM13 = DSM 14728]
MQLFASLMLLIALLGALGAGAYACLSLLTGRRNVLALIDKANIGIAGLISIASVVLTIALVSRDYSFKYVYEYVDNTLPIFYTVTAFWAGANGSLLFWLLSIAVMGVIFTRFELFNSFSEKTRLYYWLFYMVIQAFFLLLVTCWSNPFMELVPTPADGRGLNPLLRNPGMIFHPPLLFLGYAGFTSPAALALGAYLSGELKSWVAFCRNWNILSWVFLTAGIVLGCWWSYMELGWGGYWAWDPVENASLIPWLSATAFMHTAIIQMKRNALHKTNVFLMSLTLLLCVFATYLVRSGVVQSLHAYGENEVALPLLLFMLSSLGMMILVVAIGPKPDCKELSGLGSRQGLLVIAAWALLGLGLVVGLGTMWPVISQTWSPNPVGLDANFYNRVCLPLFSLIILIFTVCPWFDWKEGIRDKRGLMLSGGAFIGGGVISYAMGLHNPLALITSAASIASLVGIIGVFIFMPQMRRVTSTIGVYGLHFGVALMFLGVAWSGPNKVEHEYVVKQGESVQLGSYTMTFKKLTESQNPEISRIAAIIEVTENGKFVGLLSPERRIYRNFQQPFAEVSVIPSLGSEIYSTLLSVDAKGTATLKMSINPLINWMWIGGTMMCIFGLVAFRKPRLS